MLRIYISSTFADLEEYRKKVSTVIRRMGHLDIAMEYYVAEDQRPVDRCLADVASCDLYVGLFAWRYGWKPKVNNSEQLSITEMEYRQAANKPRLIFLMSEEHAWPKARMDKDQSDIEQFRASLAEAHGTGRPFATVENLGEMVAESIYQWEKDRGLVAPAAAPTFDVSAYYSALHRRYERIDLDALTPPQNDEYLQLQLRSVFVEQSVRQNPPPVELPKDLWERMRGEQRLSPEDLPKDFNLAAIEKARVTYLQKPSRAVLDVLTDPASRAIVLLGDPGSGKSTLTRYVILAIVTDQGDDRVRRALGNCFPILIELRLYIGARINRKADTFFEFLEYFGKSEGWHLNHTALVRRLQSHPSLLICDGLDEVFDPQERDHISRQIVALNAEYPLLRVIVTSRIIGYRRRILDNAGFQHFTLQDLDRDQMKVFLDRWYAIALSDRPSEAEDRRLRIMQSVDRSASVRQLAGNPMLLTIMAIIGKHQTLPHERWKLYEHAASVLIQHWDVNRHLDDLGSEEGFLDEEDKKELLRRLAYRMQSRPKGLAGNHIHRDDLEGEFRDYLTSRYGYAADRSSNVARAIVGQFRERNFILSHYGAQLFGFVHRAFLEFFAATAILHRFEKTREISPDDLKRQYFGAHWEDRSWHEVLALICGMLDSQFAAEIVAFLARDVYRPWPSTFFQRMPWNVVLAVKCLGEIRNPQAIQTTVAEVWETCSSLVERLFESVPGPFGDKQLELREVRLSEFIESEMLPLVRGMGSTLSDTSRAVAWFDRAYRPELMSYYRAAHPFGMFIAAFVASNTQFLKRVALQAVQPVAGAYTAIHLLGEVQWPTSLGWTVLQDIAKTAADETIRGFAVTYLAKSDIDRDRTRAWLLEVAADNEHAAAGIRDRAVSALAAFFAEDNDVVDLLLQRCSTESDSARFTAVIGLSRAVAKFPRAVAALSEALEDSYSLVRLTAFEALFARIDTRDDESDRFLTYARNETYIHNLVAMLGLIAERFPKHRPEVFDVLFAKASDATEFFRDRALEALFRLFPESDAIVELAKRAMADERNPRVAAVAIRLLGRHLRTDSEVRELLRGVSMIRPEGTLFSSDEDVRLAAMEIVATRMRKDPAAAQILRHMAAQTSDGWIVVRAAGFIEELESEAESAGRTP